MKPRSNHIRTGVGYPARGFVFHLACGALLLAGCLLSTSCSSKTGGRGSTSNSLSGYTLLWSYDAPLFWGYWGKSEDALCIANQATNTLDILDRRTGVLLRSVAVPFVEIHDDRNQPILVLDSTAHLFSSKYADDCKTVDMATGRIAVRQAPLGTIDTSWQESALVSGGKLSYRNTVTNAKWAVPFNKKGFSLLSHANVAFSPQKVYVSTTVYKGKAKLSDLGPGGYVKGKIVGYDLAAYRKRDGKFLWRLPVERRLFFRAEAGAVVLVRSEHDTFRAHAADTGKKLWQRELPGAVFSTCDQDSAVFLECNALRAVDLRTGKDAGRLAFQHDVKTRETPALYWGDAVVVCEEAKDENGKSFIRLHCYGTKARQEDRAPTTQRAPASRSSATACAAP